MFKHLFNHVVENLGIQQDVVNLLIDIYVFCLLFIEHIGIVRMSFN